MDKEYLTVKGGKIIRIPAIDNLCMMLKDKFLKQEEENDRLEKENRLLKEEIYKEEEIKKLKEEIETLKEDKLHSFKISKDSYKKIQDWVSERKQIYTGAIGGRYEYRFLPTGIGTVGKIVDTVTGEVFVFQDLD